jgi:hypothetical protein
VEPALKKLRVVNSFVMNIDPTESDYFDPNFEEPPEDDSDDYSESSSEFDEDLYGRVIYHSDSGRDLDEDWGEYWDEDYPL